MDTPLTYIITTPAGGLVLIVHSPHKDEGGGSGPSDILSGSGDAVTPLWLADLTEKALLEKVQASQSTFTPNSYLGAYADWRNTPVDTLARATWFTTLDGITRWLWNVVMGLLVEGLLSRGLDRAVLIPQGPLGLLPLDAAWTEDNTSSSGRRYALDNVTFSYTPNALALSTAQAIANQTVPNALLALDQPSPVQASDLYYSASEVEAVESHFTTATILRGEQASRPALLSALSTDSPPPIWHFSCHGAANLTDPLSSGLLLANNEWLTLRDLFALQLPAVRLVALSACETGIPGEKLPDEVINLPTGMVQAGVAGIIASLWSVNELSSMLLVVRFYDLWCDEGLTPIEALRQAQIWVRDTTNKEKADYFKGYLPEFAVNKPPKAIANDLYQLLMMQRPEQRFEHPYYWAAFGFTGV